MTLQQKLGALVSLSKQYSPHEGVNFTNIKGVGTFKASEHQGRTPFFEIASVVIVGAGRKICHVGEKAYEFTPGNVQVMLFAMPVELEVPEASPGKPLVAAWIEIDLMRMTEVLLRMERVDGTIAQPVSANSSGILTVPLNDSLLDPVIRLFESITDTMDAAMLGDTIRDEIYYRLLYHERGGELRYLLQRHGEILRISRAVEHIHTNLDQPLSVDGLAKMVYMGRTRFYESFRNVMHQTPLQYAKSVKLYTAQLMIKEGKNASEASYLVGYNSPTQFSREYKRYFGYAPSMTPRPRPALRGTRGESSL